MTRQKSHVLGFHPSSRGFGWALFEDHLTLLDWGTVDIRGDKNAITVRKVEGLLDKHQPAIFVIETHTGMAARRSLRIRRLYIAVVACAEDRGVAVHSYSRADITNSRFMNGACTREEVAIAVANCLEALRPRLPKPRPLWIGERSSMRLFCAAACALAYFDSEVFVAKQRTGGR